MTKHGDISGSGSKMVVLRRTVREVQDGSYRGLPTEDNLGQKSDGVRNLG